MRKTIISISLLAIFTLYLIKSVFNVDINLYTGALSAVVLMLHALHMGKTFRRPTLMFAITGAVLLAISAAPLSVWLNGFSKMLSSVAILIALQSFASAVNIGNYEEVVGVFLRKRVKNPIVLYVVLLVTTHVLTAVMSLGSVVILLMMLVPLLKKMLDGYDEYLINALAVGYSTLFFWSPSGVTVLMGTQIFRLDWVDYVGPALILTAVELVVMSASGALKFRKAKFRELEIDVSENKQYKVHVSDILAVIISLVIVVVILEKTGFSDSTGRVVISGTLVGFVWLLLLTGKNFIRLVPKDFWNNRLSSNADLYTFFMSMGLFSAAISYSGAEKLIASLLMSVSGVLEVAIIPVMPAIIILLSMIGVHPFVSLLVIGPVVFSMGLSTPPIILALSACFGCALSYMISPFSGLMLTMASQFGQPPAKLCYKFNKLPALEYYFIGVVTLIIMNTMY